MKRFLSIFLSVALLATMLTGLNLNVFADEPIIINLDERCEIEFVEDELNFICFTPQESGTYVFEDSLADRILWDSQRFESEFHDENGIVESLSTEWLAYVLESGKTYTFTVRMVEGEPETEAFSVRMVTTAVSVDFVPNWDNFSFYNNNLTSDDCFYVQGNELNVTFSDGDEKTFICNDNRRYVYYRDEDDRDGIELKDYANEKGASIDCEPRARAYPLFWTAGEDFNFIYINVGCAQQQFFVDDYIVESPYKSISFSGTPIEAYNGTAYSEWGLNNNGEWVEYQRYDINRWDLERDGNALTVTYNDDTTKTYTCHWYEDVQFFGFRSEDGEIISTEEFLLYDLQSPDIPWQNGGAYNVDIFFRGQRCMFSAQVVEPPVSSIEVQTSKNIEVFENMNGRWEYDEEADEDYFRYDDMYDYLRSVDAEITVHYSDENRNDEVYDFHNKDWLPCNENDERIDERYFEFRFDQDENRMALGSNNRAYVSFYGKKAYINVDVVKQHAVNDGELNADETKHIFFLGGEVHSFTFTPDKKGVYEFCDSLADRVREGDEFGFTVTDESGDEVERLVVENRDDVLFSLFADEEYTVTTKLNREGSSLEYISFRSRVSVKKVEFIPANGTIEVVAGDFGRGREIFEEGSVIKVTFSDGNDESFTCNDRGEFRNGEGKDINDFANDLEVYCECDLRISPSAESWEAGTSPYYTLTVGNAKTKVYLTVNSSDVESIAYHSAKTPGMVKDIDFEFDEGKSFTRINCDPFFTGDTVDVTYSDDRGTVTYKYDRDDVFYIDTDYGREEIFLGYTFDSGRDYEIGDNMEFTFAYRGGTASVSAAVIANDVERIEFTAECSYSVYKELNGWWEHKDAWDEDREEEIHEDFFHYDIPDFRQRGNVIKVFYTDETEAEFVYNGRWFMDEDGNRLDNRYIYDHDEQWEEHWYEDTENIFYVGYKGKLAPVPISVVDKGDWRLGVTVHDSRGFTYEDGDTLFIEKGQRVFVYFETDPRNREYGIADIVGFSDGYDEGTLTNRGFDVETGNDFNFGCSFGDTFGFMLGTNNLKVGTKGVLNYNLYEFEGDNYDNFDFVNTPHPEGGDYSINVEIVDHQFEESAVIPATCTEKGYTEYTCTLCGITYRADFTDYAEHDYEVQIFEATPNARGYKQFSCKHCGYEYCGEFTDYASDASALEAAITEAHYYSKSKFSNEQIQLIIDEAESHRELSVTNAPQAEYDYAVGEILTAIQGVDELAKYTPVSIDDESNTVTLENGEGDEKEVSFEEAINEYEAPLDVVKDGIVNAKDFAYLIKNFA